MHYIYSDIYTVFIETIRLLAHCAIMRHLPGQTEKKTKN